MVKKIVLVIVFSLSGILAARSIHRPERKHIPEIITRWQDAPQTYHLKNWYLTEHAIFHLYDEQYFKEHLLPQEEISFRNEPKRSVSGEKLQEMIDELVYEILARKRCFMHFRILKQEDFNWNEPAGMLAFKFNEYPFVVKLFLETPQSFVKPYSKGWRPSFFFIMGGGVHRYLSAFTRIPNLEYIRKKIDESPYWREQTDTPRKWYYLPDDVAWFQVWGKNFSPCTTPYIELPSVYGIVADAIEGEPLKKHKERDRTFGIRLAQYLGNALDAHIDNFIVERATGKVVIIDSEHFITTTGISPNLRYSRYTKWYLKIVWKATKDLFFRGKRTRRYRYRPPYQATQDPLKLLCDEHLEEDGYPACASSPEISGDQDQIVISTAS